MLWSLYIDRAFPKWVADLKNQVLLSSESVSLCHSEFQFENLGAENALGL
jgi:hypothetical protein